MNLPAGWTTTTVDRDGVSLETYRTGEGPPIVMAHGFYDTGRRWVPLADELADEHTVLTYDARGHGRSDAPESGYTLDDRIADLRRVVAANGFDAPGLDANGFDAPGFDASGFDAPVLLGHSMGAATVAWAAARYPDWPRGLVLVDPVGVHDEPDIGPEERAEMTRQNIAEAAEKSVDELVDEHYADEDPEQARRLAAGSKEINPEAAAIAREGYPDPLRSAFADITCPTLILRRDTDVEDRVRDLGAAAELQEGRLVHVSDAGHYVFRDAFDAALAELRAFLRRLDEREG